jgi:hypothetical protein
MSTPGSSMVITVDKTEKIPEKLKISLEERAIATLFGAGDISSAPPTPVISVTLSQEAQRDKQEGSPILFASGDFAARKSSLVQVKRTETESRSSYAKNFKNLLDERANPHEQNLTILSLLNPIKKQ